MSTDSAMKNPLEKSPVCAICGVFIFERVARCDDGVITVLALKK